MATTVYHIKVKGVKIPLIFKQDKRLPLVSMQLVFKASGSALDKAAGLANLSACIMNEGTKELGSVGFASALDAKAIHMSASAGVETLVIESGCLKEQFGSAIQLLSALLKNPNLTQESLVKVKTDILGKISAKENDYDYVASNLLRTLLFAKTPLAHSRLGDAKSINQITLEDIKVFLNQHIVLSNLIVVMGGDISLKEAKERASLLAEELSAGTICKLPRFITNTNSKEKILQKETQQAYIYFGAPYNIEVADKDYYKAKVATYILGSGGFGSRLMEEIRVKKGLAYSAYASLHVNHSATYLSGYLQTKTQSLQEAKDTVNVVFKQFVENGILNEELKQAKRFLLGSEPLRVETLSQQLSRAFLEYYRGQKPGHYATELQKIDDLSLKGLNDFIKQHKEILNLSYAIVTK